MAARSVDAATLKRWLDNGEAILVDVREPAEHNAERIAQATSVPLGRIGSEDVAQSGAKKIVIHCLKGGRGASACEKLLAQDPSLELYNLEGGIASWSAQGLPTMKPG